MKAIKRRSTPSGSVSSPAGSAAPPAGPASLSESSAAFFAREQAETILSELDGFRRQHHMAARLAEILLLRDLAARLAPVLLNAAQEVVR